MLQPLVLFLILMLFAVSIFVMLGNKVRISAPITLVLAGLLIGIIPFMPELPIWPELIFTVFLPPLLFEAAWYTHWHAFWKNKRTIILLAFGLVFFNSFIIAFVSSALIPGFTLALGFLLGGIISPPDAVAATSVLKGIKMPRNINTILEGESLVNDASSLIVVRFAIAAVLTGAFDFREAVGDFFLMTFGGIGIGIAVAYAFYWLHRKLPTTPNIDTALTFMAPYIMYLLAESFHFSGVMAVVSGGLFLSYRSHEMLTHQSRIQSRASWQTLIFILNGLIFILIGLQLPIIVKNMGTHTLLEATIISLIISAVCIIIRLLWIFPAMFLPRIFPRIRAKEHNPGWQTPAVIGWAGMRGVISLAAAFNIPILLSNGNAFPYRDLILFITFVVILVTLVFQGLTLPWMVKKLNIPEPPQTLSEQEQELAIKLRLAKMSIREIDEKFPEEAENNPLVQRMKATLESQINRNISLIFSNEAIDETRVGFKKVMLHIFEMQRKELMSLRSEIMYNDDELQRQFAAIDLEEMRMNLLLTVEVEEK